MYLTFPTDHRVKIKESKKMTKSLYIASELKKKKKKEKEKKGKQYRDSDTNRRCRRSNSLQQLEKETDVSEDQRKRSHDGNEVSWHRSNEV